MNNTGNNLTAAVIDSIIQETYESNIFFWLFVSSTTLLFYATLLKLPQEIAHIWFKSFSLPTWLYIFARYGILAQQGLNLSVSFIPLGRTCNMLANAANAFTILQFIGTQGLLVARGYALCQGHKISTMALAFGFLSNAVLLLYEVIAFAGCFSIIIVPTADYIAGFIGSVCVICTDILIFSLCMWKVWGTWKLKHEAGIQSGHSLVSVLIKQSVLRCCFVIIITITDSVLLLKVHIVNSSSFKFFVLSKSFNNFQAALSSILVADFTLDLRSLNSAKIEASNASLPPLQFSNVLQRVSQSFIVELATPGDRGVEGGEDVDDLNHDNPEQAAPMEDIQPAEE